MTQEQVDELVRTILLEKKGWAERLPLVREEMDRLRIGVFDLTIWLRDHGVRTARGPISERTVWRIMAGETAPDANVQDAIVDMLVEAATGKWSKARYISWTRVVDVIRPRFAPQVTHKRVPIAEFFPLRVAA